MRRVVAALVVCLGLAVPACALASASGSVVEAGFDVDQELVGLRTVDGLRIKDADCRPQGKSFSIVDLKLASALWTCYVSDGLSRVYNVTAHVRNAIAPGDVGSLDRVTVFSCWDRWSNFPCSQHPKIVATPASVGPEQETLPLVQRQLLALKLTDGTRIRQADCRPITSHWSVGSDFRIFGDLWTCYVSDGVKRVYNVNVHVRNSKAPGLDRVTILNCWPTYANFGCTRGEKIVLPDTDKRTGKRKVLQFIKTGK
jgi:hypothetical protein